MAEDQSAGQLPQAILAAYCGCWVALIGDQVAGVGASEEAARLAARRSRPRERITAVFFVPVAPDTQTEPQ